jgi:hypothetical protein
MNDQKIYSRKKISKILNRASEIQTQKDLYGDREGLTEEELVQLAEEVGIDKESLVTALQEDEINDFSQDYNWYKGTSRIQSVSSVDAEFTPEQWEEVIQEIRKVTGGIGKVTRNSTSYEWEQRRSDIGYKHLTLTPKDGRTKLQMVTSWNALRTMAGFIGSFFGAILLLIIFKEAFSKQVGLMFAPAGGFAGFLLSRVFLKGYYENQKKELNKLIQSLSAKIRSLGKGKITIEDQEVYETNSQSSSTRKINS